MYSNLIQAIQAKWQVLCTKLHEFQLGVIRKKATPETKVRICAVMGKRARPEIQRAPPKVKLYPQHRDMKRSQNELSPIQEEPLSELENEG